MIEHSIEELLRRRHTTLPTRPPYKPYKRSKLKRFFDVISPDNINRWLQRYHDFMIALIFGH